MSVSTLVLVGAGAALSEAASTLKTSASMVGFAGRGERVDPVNVRNCTRRFLGVHSAVLSSVSVIGLGVSGHYWDANVLPGGLGHMDVVSFSESF